MNATSAGPIERSAFTVSLTNFSGPFDLLLQLISKHKLDVTEVALSQVTDDFIAHIKAAQASQGSTWWDLDQSSSFIVIAATLLDLKAARLLPSGEVDDAEDLALLEARDLLFARLLQYRAFKIVSGWISETLNQQARRYPRPGGLEERFAKLLPAPTLDGFADVIAAFAARAMTPTEPTVVPLAHLHMPLVSVREQADLLVSRLREHSSLSFRSLTADASDKLVVVARFLALLELFRERAVTFEQLNPLGELTVRWLGNEIDPDAIGAEFDAADIPAAPAETNEDDDA
ncbi:MAG: segregation/condensation protein A [Actinobacteria bacterium HGW-Actinobacteria-2]|nr:MAG: segregation/condensation protein A [Actinobacteria bacterium HGW-Actinobacteria-2]